jgi:predicted transcriptional regulator
MTDAENSVLDRDELLQMTVDIVSAYVSNNAIASAQIPELISTIFNSLDVLREDETIEEEEPLKPAVPIRKSIGDDYIICLEDGKKLKMLKRHLRTTYNLTPEEYQAK